MWIGDCAKCLWKAFALGREVQHKQIAQRGRVHFLHGKHNEVCGSRTDRNKEDLSNFLHLYSTLIQGLK